MDDDATVLRHLYRLFNARDLDGVLALLAPDVAWANGMDGGHVHGRGGVRDYWTRQWAMVSPHVEPLGFSAEPDGSVAVEVRQEIRDLAGRRLDGGAGGLRDAAVVHVFRLRDGKVTRFDIRSAGHSAEDPSRISSAPR